MFVARLYYTQYITIAVPSTFSIFLFIVYGLISIRIMVKIILVASYVWLLHAAL